MIRIFLITLLVCTAPIGVAESWAERASDTALTRAEVVELTAGQTLIFFDDGQSQFSVGGSYSYSYGNNGGTAFGRFTVGDDGQVCIAYRNGFSRCDRYVHSGDRLVMLTEKGERFPIKGRFDN